MFLTPLEVKLFREQLLVRAPGTPLVFPTPTGQSWNRSGFRERVWVKAVKAALKGEESEPDRPSVFEGFTFHLLRHTACSLMASAGMDPAVAAERAGHTDGGALFLRTYRHLYEAEKRTQALRLEARSSPTWPLFGQTARTRAEVGSTKPRTGMGAPGIEPGTSRV